MAFPYLLDAGFEAAATDFDTALTDSQSKSLGYLHYSDTVRRFGLVPYRGAYCWGLDQSVGTKTTGCYQTQAAFNVAATNTWCVGLALYLKGNVMTNGDRTTLVSVRSAGADETVLELYYTTAGGLQLLFCEASNTAVGANPVCSITENEWHWIEMYGTVDAGGGNDGTATLIVDGRTIGSLASLDQAAITDLFVGALNGDAGHSAGYIFFDEVIADGDAGTSAVRIGYPYPRFPQELTVTKSQHVFVGPGTVAAAAMLSTTAGNTMTLYDTDTAYTSSGQSFKAELAIGANTSIQGPITFKRGCYAAVSGTNPRGHVILDMGDTFNGRGLPRLEAYSSAGMKNYAMRRKARPGNI